jgi:hypothetical protein
MTGQSKIDEAYTSMRLERCEDSPDIGSPRSSRNETNECGRLSSLFLFPSHPRHSLLTGGQLLDKPSHGAPPVRRIAHKSSPNRFHHGGLILNRGDYYDDSQSLQYRKTTVNGDRVVVFPGDCFIAEVCTPLPTLCCSTLPIIPICLKSPTLTEELCTMRRPCSLCVSLHRAICAGTGLASAKNYARVQGGT